MNKINKLGLEKLAIAYLSVNYHIDNDEYTTDTHYKKELNAMKNELKKALDKAKMFSK